MSRQEPLQSAYDFTSAPDPVYLLQGAVELELDDQRLTGTADLLLLFLPNPRVIFRARVLCEPGRAIHFVLSEPVNPSLSFNGQKIEGFLGKCETDADTLVLYWHPKFEPVKLGGINSRASVAVVLHLFNFPDFCGGQHQSALAPAGCSILLLESELWRIFLQSLPNNATYQAWKKIKNEGGYFLTHVARLERKDGKPFSQEEAHEQRSLLTNVLSFTLGGKFYTVCDVGFDATGERTWSALSSPRAINAPYSWFNPFQANQAERLFPLFAKRWQQSDEWRGCLRSAVYWYAQANTSGGSPGIDAAIILAQSALERLAYHHLVVDKQAISARKLDKLKASERLRLLFSSLSLPLDIDTVTPNLLRAAQNFKWVDAPHAMTDIRNELAHPVNKKQVVDCFIDAWKLSLWYLELSVLAMCGYDATYTSRLTARSVTDSELVPWAKAGNAA